LPISAGTWQYRAFIRTACSEEYSEIFEIVVSPAQLTATADMISRKYGISNPVLTISYSGFVKGDNVSAITEPVINTTAMTSSLPGIYPITLSGGSAENYILSLVNGNLTVNRADLTFIAESKSKNYLGSNPELTYKISGFKNGENESVLDVLPVIQTTAVQNSSAGSYSITLSGGADDCYNYIYQPGILTILKIYQAITITSAPSKLYMNEVASIDASSTSGLPVQFESVEPKVVLVEGNQVSGVSTGKTMIRAFTPDDVNYFAAEAFAEVEVTSTHRDIMHLFTPNGDGINDRWEILEMPTYGKCEVKVYNRWGKEVYSNKNYDNLWDGTSNGSPLPEGAYYFIIKTENSGIIKGTVNIVR
jgi:gliding motility-associated-like protein